MTSFSSRLRYYRQRAGLSQQKIGEMLGVSAVAVGKWEKGQAEPGIDKLLALAEKFGVSMDDLCGREGNVPMMTAMGKGFARLSEEEQKKLLEVGRVLFGRRLEDEEDVPWRE